MILCQLANSVLSILSSEFKTIGLLLRWEKLVELVSLHYMVRCCFERGSELHSFFFNLFKVISKVQGAT